jgi:RNA polymerase-binding transcription factor DksA
MALNDAQRRHLEARLREERERVLTVLRRYDETRATTQAAAAGDLSDYPLHPADHGTDNYDQEMETVFAERASRELEAIDRALHQLYEDPGHFGICDNTGEPIPFERLDVIPWARTRIEVEEEL